MVFTTRILNQIGHLTKMNVVDNSAIGRQVKEAGKHVKVIGVYNGTKYMTGTIGDRVLVTILGQMKHGVVVGVRQRQKAFIPRFDNNNIVLVDKENVPLGTRVNVPLPNILRKKGALTARIMAIGTRFI